MPRPTQDSTIYTTNFKYEGFTLFALAFHLVLLSIVIECRSPTTPVASNWFALLPFRSPLLWVSRLISTPVGTEMFHFSTFAFLSE